jgi:diguanylate cyclase (GGDEF)-like protein/PAS domain S-box-containing protein
MGSSARWGWGQGRAARPPSRPGSLLRSRFEAERDLQRCRLWFAAVAVVQALLYPADRVWLSWVLIAVIVATAAVVHRVLRSDPSLTTMRRLGIGVMAADTLVVALALANLLRDPTDPVQGLPVVIAGEGAVRWGRNGGIAAGFLAGAMSAAWSVASHHRAGLDLPIAFVTFRIATMVGMGLLLGGAFSMARRERRLAEAVTEASSDLIATFGFDGTVRSVNPACEEILGYRPSELIGKDRADLMIDVQRPFGPPNVEALRATGQRHVEVRFRHREGHDVWLEVDLQADMEERVICAIGRDVSDRRRAEAELRHRAEHDDLTGAANRAHLVGRLARDLIEAGRVHLLFVDLDEFKAVNDRFGHRAGDTVLREAATRIRVVCGRDDLVVRLSGDEFCVLLQAPADDALAALRAREVTAALDAPYGLPQGTIHLGASVGWAASLPDDGPADVLERADLAMYETKRARRAPSPRPQPDPFPG